MFTDPLVQLVMPTAGEDMELSLRRTIRNRRERRRAAEELLAAHGLAGLANRSIYDLSGGQRQRLALATVLATDPALLVADEPTTLLDLDWTLEVQELLLALPGTGQCRQLVYTTHDLDFAARADRCLVVAGGRIVHDGDGPGAVAWYAGTCGRSAPPGRSTGPDRSPCGEPARPPAGDLPRPPGSAGREVRGAAGADRGPGGLAPARGGRRPAGGGVRPVPAGRAPARVPGPLAARLAPAGLRRRGPLRVRGLRARSPVPPGRPRTGAGGRGRRLRRPGGRAPAGDHYPGHRIAGRPGPLLRCLPPSGVNPEAAALAVNVMLRTIPWIGAAVRAHAEALASAACAAGRCG